MALKLQLLRQFVQRNMVSFILFWFWSINGHPCRKYCDKPVPTPVLRWGMSIWKTTIYGLVVVAGLAGCKHDYINHNFAEQTASPQILSPIEFVDFCVIGPVSKQGVDHLLSERVKIGSSDADAYDFLVSGEGQEQKRVRAETVAEYLKARKSGAYAYNTFDLAMDSFFERTASALVFLQRAESAKTNYLNGMSLLNLSVSFVYFPEQDGIDRIAHDVKTGLRLRDYARSHTIWNVKLISLNEITFTTGLLDYDVELIACGDYDYDGFEDGLLFVIYHYHEGSGLGYNTYLISKTNPNSLITLRDFVCWH